MPHRTLIETSTLADMLGDPSLVIVDCRFKLDDTAWGEAQYAAAHIPGARYAHLDRDLSGVKTGRNGRHPLPEPEVLAATFGRLGISNGKQVVAYDQDNGAWASRLWWMLRWLGHDDVAVLHGGFAAWQREQRPTRSGVEPATPQPFAAHLRPERLADLPAVERVVAGREPGQLVDSRAPERYRGEVEPVDPRAGHIPGAINHAFKANTDESGRFLTPEALRAGFTATLGSVRPSDLIFYCGSGVTACQNLLALEHVGLPGARLYVGSWSEWSSDPTRAVSKGDER